MEEPEQELTLADCPPHITRMYQEWVDLKNKVTALSEFIKSNPTFLTLEKEDKDLMKTQLDAMCIYSRTLLRRLARAGVKISYT